MAKKAQPSHGGSRPGAGRKKGPPVKRVALTLPVDLLDRIDKLAYSTTEGRSAYIAMLLEKALKQK